MVDQPLELLSPAWIQWPAVMIARLPIEEAEQT